MAIRKRGDSWQVDVKVDGKRVRRDFADAAEADAFERECKAADLTGRALPPALRTVTAFTLKQAFDRCYAVRWKGTPGERPAVTNGEAAIAYFGKDKDIKEIRTTDVRDYVLSLEKAGNASGTVNRKLAALSAIISVAVEDGRIDPDKRPRLERKKEGQGRISWVTETEEVQMVALLRQWGYFDEANLVLFLIDTGVRLSEAFRVRWTDVSDDRVHVWETKADLPRTVPLTRKARAALDSQRQRHGDKTGPFAHMADTLHRLRAAWDRLAVALGKQDDKNFVLHILRHTCASRLVQRGVPIQVVQQWLGHKTLAMTLRYAHLSPKNLLDAAKVLETDQSPVFELVTNGVTKQG